jgi:hypothetical protein
MTINRRELLLFIAIATSSIVFEVRQHALDTHAVTRSEPSRGQVCDSQGAARPEHIAPATCGMFRARAVAARKTWV